MHPYPHIYSVSARGGATATVEVSSSGLAPIQTAPPPQFDGPGDLWSPETLLCAAVADCFILTFRVIARAAHVEWMSLECQTKGHLQKTDGGTRFTRYETHAILSVREGTNVEKMKALLERAEHSCLVANSLNGTRSLTTEVTLVGGPIPSANSPK